MIARPAALAAAHAMTHPVLSLCMIVRDEEPHLDRALASVRGLVDEIVVVDTGSQDRTMDIARAHGARTEALAWQDDFSAARNHAIDVARGEWILMLDADEVIAHRDHALIREALADAAIDAVDATARNYFDYPTATLWTAGDGGYEEGVGFAGFCDLQCRRLFRRQPWIRFQGRVHEMLVSVDPTRPLRRREDRWVVHHFGKRSIAGPLTKKWERYLRIGQRKLEEAPASPQAHYELGVQYLELDRPAEALPFFQQADALSADYRQSLLLAGICEARLDRNEAALATLERAARNPLSRNEATLQRANLLLKARRTDAALRDLSELCAGPTPPVGGMVAIAVALNRKGRGEEARAWLDRAVTLAPTDPPARCERALQRLRAGDPDGAMDDAERAGSSRIAQLLRARVQVVRRQFADALRTLTAFDDQKHPEKLVLEAGVALGLGEYAHAAACCRASFDAQPSVEAALNLAVALEAIGDLPAARAALGEGLQIEPEHPVLLARHRRLQPVRSVAE